MGRLRSGHPGHTVYRDAAATAQLLGTAFVTTSPGRASDRARPVGVIFDGFSEGCALVVMSWGLSRAFARAWIDSLGEARCIEITLRLAGLSLKRRLTSYLPRLPHDPF